MKTKFLYKDHLWEAIAAHPDYDLGRRELGALIRFLPTVAQNVPSELDVLHLASSTGREVPAIVSAIPEIRNYLLNDIVPEVMERSRQELKVLFPAVNFLGSSVDIEAAGNIFKLRRRLSRPTLIVLAANGVIFSNRQMDSNVREAMRGEDLFLLTLEKAHEQMFRSYLIPPVFELLSESRKQVNKRTVRTSYSRLTSTMHLACGGEDLLVSYKPTTDELRRRMAKAGFVEVVFRRYGDLHMLAGLYRGR